MQFLYPNVLFFMLIPTILLAFFITTNKKNIEKHFTKEALNKLQVSNKFLSQTSRNILFFIAILLMIISLSRPVLDKKEKQIQQETTSYIVALDVSKSMFAQDLSPNRFAFAKTKLLNFIEHSKDKEIGIILFSSSSYILSPLTYDTTSLKELVNNLNSSIKLENGSEISTAIKTASKLLKNKTNKNLVILTDGTDKQDFQEEITLANSLNINIYTLGIATNKKSVIKIDENQYLTDEKGNIVTVSLNQEIKQLSLNTQGAYINFTFNNSDIKQILQVIDEKKEKNDIKKYKVYTELFYFPLALALLILLIAFSSLPKLKYLSFVLLLSISTKSEASLTDFKTIDKATILYENQNYKEASKEFKKVAKNSEAHYNFANSLYKEKKYKEAIKEYKKVVTSNEELEFKKLHNLGNSYTKLNNLEDAIKMYEKALKIKEDKQTRENLEIVKKALKEKQSNKDNKQKDQEKQNSKEENKHNQEKDKENSKEKNKNNQEKDKENSKEENKNNQEKDKENSKEENKNNQEKDKENSKEKNKNNQENISEKQKKKKESKKKNPSLEKQKAFISDLEEKKWLKELENSFPVFLKKDEEKNTDSKW